MTWPAAGTVGAALVPAADGLPFSQVPRSGHVRTGRGSIPHDG